MSYARTQDYELGQVLMACSICGVAYLFPDELVRGSDALFRCKRTCEEQPIRDRDKLIAESHKRREMPPPKFGIPPSWTPLVTNGAGGFVVADFAFGHGSISIPSLTFTSDFVGRSLTLVNTGGVPSNDGTWHIIAIIDANTVEVSETMPSDQPLDSGCQVTVTL